jgi:hypothetical protein
VIDTPGTGEPLRLRNVPSRPDYEVPTTAIVDYLVTRPDIDPERIGLLGISLGGYYAPRGASFEHRIKACAAWGGVWDYGAVWQHRWDTQSKHTPVCRAIESKPWRIRSTSSARCCAAGATGPVLRSSGCPSPRTGGRAGSAAKSSPAWPVFSPTTSSSSHRAGRARPRPRS